MGDEVKIEETRTLSTDVEGKAVEGDETDANGDGDEAKDGEKGDEPEGE